MGWITRSSGRRVSDAWMEALERRCLLSTEMLPYRLYMPEGFAAGGIYEFAPITNPNDEPAEFEVWAHFETGERDLLLASGVMVGNSRGGVTLSYPQDPVMGLVPSGRPYAMEIRSSLPLVATMSRYDRGASGENFTAETSTTWVVANADLSGGANDSFLVWFNPADVEAELTITFYQLTEQGVEATVEPVTLHADTASMRRGGLALRQLEALSALEGPVSIEVVADVPIVVGYSGYGPEGAYFVLGTPSGGLTDGVVGYWWHSLKEPPDPEAGQHTVISVFNPSHSDPVSVTLTFESFSLEGSVGLPEPLVVPPRSARFVTTAAIQWEPDAYQSQFGIAAFTSTGPVYPQALVQRGDFAQAERTSSPPSALSSRRMLFAEGFVEADRLYTFGSAITRVSIYSPTLDNSITVKIRYPDGYVVEFSASRNDHLSGFVSMMEEVAWGASNPQRYFFSVEIVATEPIVAFMWHHDGVLTADEFFGEFVLTGAPLEM